MSIEQFLDNYDERIINDIATEYGILMDWFEKEYPEGRIRLDVNNDKRTGVLKYKLSVLTGKEMADNQGYFENTITIDRQKFENTQWMDAYKSSIVSMYKKRISDAVNNHLTQERIKQQ